MCNVARLYVAIRPKRLRVLANLSQARRDLIYILLEYVRNKVKKFYLINLKYANIVSLVYGLTILVLK